MTLERARLEDAPLLAEISRRAFHSDVNCGAPNPEGGPPGYDSADWQRAMMASANYDEIVLNEGLPDGGRTIIGGMISFAQGDGHYTLGRVFLDPGYHRRGLGLAAIRLLFARYPDARRWSLDTPTWNVRTRAFYRKLGFVVTKETDEFVFFEWMA